MISRAFGTPRQGERGGTESWHVAARRARALSWVSLLWMSGEGVLGLIAGAASESVSLTGWALGSTIEGMASVIVIWRFTGSRTLSQSSERRAGRGVAVSFYLLAPYITVQAINDLLTGHRLTDSTLGLVVTAASVLVMPVLGLAKRRLGQHLGSGATAGKAPRTCCAPPRAPPSWSA
jgi:divalent metal cation (Fe/Co/Zn/Cd) transporter